MYEGKDVGCVVCSLDYEEQVLVDGTQGRTTVHPAQSV